MARDLKATEQKLRDLMDMFVPKSDVADEVISSLAVSVKTRLAVKIFAQSHNMTVRAATLLLLQTGMAELLRRNYPRQRQRMTPMLARQSPSEMT